MGSFNMNKEPALLIGTLVTIILGVVTTLAGDGIISDALAGKITDIVNAGAQLLVLLIPIITGILIRGQVYSPNTYDKK